MARYLQGGKAAPRLDALVPFVQLLAWAKQHAGWEGVSGGPWTVAWRRAAEAPVPALRAAHPAISHIRAFCGGARARNT